MAMALLNFGPSMVGPMISLRVKELDPAGQAATAAGLIFSLMGAAAAVSSFASGRLGERVKLPTIMVFCCVAAGLFYLPPIWAGSVTALMVLLALGGLVRGGISTTSNAMVGLSVPQGQEGIAYGLAQSAGRSWWGLGPLVGGSVVSAMGIRPVFGMAAAVYVFVGLFVGSCSAASALERLEHRHGRAADDGLPALAGDSLGQELRAPVSIAGAAVSASFMSEAGHDADEQARRRRPGRGRT